MSQFYRKYKNLFLTQQQPIKQPTKQHQHQLIHRGYSLNPQKNNQKHLRQSEVKIKKLREEQRLGNRFEQQIMPQLQKMNKKNEKLIGFTQVRYPIFYTPQRNKNNKIGDYTTQAVQHVYTPVVKSKFRQQFNQLEFHRKNQQHSTLNPQKSTPYPQPHPLPKPLKTQPTPSSPQQSILKYLPRIDHSRNGYGYPQINNGLIFSEYEQQNQYKLVNSRIKDIRWIEKYYPRGNINQYRQALLRRKDFKQKIGDRRARLKKLLEEERKIFDRKRSIV